jgi:hypothetical protein
MRQRARLALSEGGPARLAKGPVGIINAGWPGLRSRRWAYAAPAHIGLGGGPILGRNDPQGRQRQAAGFMATQIGERQTLVLAPPDH